MGEGMETPLFKDLMDRSKLEVRGLSVKIIRLYKEEDERWTIKGMLGIE